MFIHQVLCSKVNKDIVHTTSFQRAKYESHVLQTSSCFKILLKIWFLKEKRGRKQHKSFRHSAQLYTSRLSRAHGKPNLLR